MGTQINFAQLFDGLTAEQIFKLGGVMTVYGHRAHARKAAKVAKAAYASAKRDYAEFGRYADCGPSYEASRDEAKALFVAAVNVKISAEKYFQLTCHEFRNAGGAEDKLQMLVQALAAQHNGHVN